MSDQGPRVEGARGEEMRQRMQASKEAGSCDFCKVVAGEDSEHRSPVFLKGKHWVATKNDFPYPGTSAHVLVLSRDHVNDLDELSIGALQELTPFLLQVAQSLGLTGYCTFARLGDKDLTAQTMPHLHFHITQSDGSAVTFEDVPEDMLAVIRALPGDLPNDSDGLKRLWEAISIYRSALEGKAIGIYPKLSNKAFSN